MPKFTKTLVGEYVTAALAGLTDDAEKRAALAQVRREVTWATAYCVDGGRDVEGPEVRAELETKVTAELAKLPVPDEGA